MFSPAAGKSILGRLKGNSPPTNKNKNRNPNANANANGPASPATPASSSLFDVPSRPSTGTPAPWTSRLSSARSQVLKKKEKSSTSKISSPLHVCDFPRQLCDAQIEWMRSNKSNISGISGGLDKDTGLCWVLCNGSVYIWSYLSGKQCVALKLPSNICFSDSNEIGENYGSKWIGSIIQRNRADDGKKHSSVTECSSAGLLICSPKSLAVVYWPDICSNDHSSPIVHFENDEQCDISDKLVDDAPSADSIIATDIPQSSYGCIAIVCRANAELWKFECSSNSIKKQQLLVNSGKKTSIRSITWCSRGCVPKTNHRGFFVLTKHEIQCWVMELMHGGNVSTFSNHEIPVTNEYGAIGMRLPGEKHVFPLDMKVDYDRQEIKMLIASLKEGTDKLSYCQYSLITLDNTPFDKIFESPKTASLHALSSKCQPQVIVENECIQDRSLLFSMRLQIGGKPEGSVMILAGDGSATVVSNQNKVTHLYQFVLPQDTGKVIDASTIHSIEDSSVAWLVLTEKVGIWAIPEKAITFSGVGSVEASLSQKGSFNKNLTEIHKISIESNNESRQGVSFSKAEIVGNETYESGQKQSLRHIVHEDEAETLIGCLFNEFLNSGSAKEALVKLQQAGAFEREGEANPFTKTSKAIVDTLAKHWTSNRAANVAVMAVVSSQLLEKQRRHQNFLQFLAVSKCHEILQERQREALLAIMAHGEKLAAMTQLRELHNMHAQSKPENHFDTPNKEQEHNLINSSLWDLVQLVGEKIRRKNIILMDRDKAEVFYSRVSDLEELFACVEEHLHHIIGGNLPLRLQIERLSVIANACVSILRTVARYRDIQYPWYPSPEGLTPWYCQSTVRSGLCEVAYLIIEIKKEADVAEPSLKAELVGHLEKVTDILLETFAGAITAKVELEEEYRAIQAEYWKKRDVLLNALYLHIKEVAESTAQNSANQKEAERIKQETFRAQASFLIALAKRHAGYQTLWDICSYLNDMECLQSLMRESMGLKEGRFSNFVFEQCYKKQAYGKLLRLGEEFPQELEMFLQKYKELLWLHEIFLGNFSSASRNLHILSLSQKEVKVVSGEEVEEADIPKMNLSFRERRNLLNLSKIAAVAGQESNFEDITKRLDADLHILAVQEKLHAEGYCGQEILSPRQLVEICLNSRDCNVVLLAFEVFAWAGESFRTNNRSLLESLWLIAADIDDWIDIYKSSEGWSDERKVETLCHTMLFYASVRCYGADSLFYEGSFKNVLPLLREDAEVSDTGLMESSLETILMQHKDFPEAGDLMLLAVRLGACNGVESDADGSIMMES